MSAAEVPDCTCPIGGPFVVICPTHFVADPKSIEFGVSDLPTLRKLASVYTALTADESVEAPASFVNRVVSQVMTRMVATLSRKLSPDHARPPSDGSDAELFYLRGYEAGVRQERANQAARERSGAQPPPEPIEIKYESELPSLRQRLRGRGDQ